MVYGLQLIPILIYFSRLSVIALKKHSAETHEKYLQVCNICQAAFETYNQLKEHRNTGWDFVKKKIYQIPQFLSSPSACLRSGASRNRFWCFFVLFVILPNFSSFSSFFTSLSPSKLFTFSFFVHLIFFRFLKFS